MDVLDYYPIYFIDKITITDLKVSQTSIYKRFINDRSIDKFKKLRWKQYGKRYNITDRHPTRILIFLKKVQTLCAHNGFFIFMGLKFGKIKIGTRNNPPY